MIHLIQDITQLPRMIKTLRELQDLSREELASRIDVTPGSIRNYETQKNIGVLRLRRIFKALGYRMEIRLVKE